MKGVGVHVFAGGFTMGMKRVHDVTCQLEIHNFGRATCEAHNTKFINADTWEGWFEHEESWKGSQFCYGNPRCNAFSGYSSGGSDAVRGPRAKNTQDIWDLCRFGIKAGLDLIAFESVQQAYTVGRPLICMLRDDLFKPNHYRIAHLFVNTAAEGNAQHRQRYFFVAYRDDRPFNVYKPILPEYRTTVGDVLNSPVFKNSHPHEQRIRGHKYTDYDFDSYSLLSEHSKRLIPCMLEDESFHSVAKRRPEQMEQTSPHHYEKWLLRTSNLPFSLHSPKRLACHKHCPVICSTSCNLIHPHEDRSLTVGEIAAMMGWPDKFIPAGADPISQIGKGVVPATGAWLGEQIRAYFDNDWGHDDFESAYCHKSDCWYGTDYTNSSDKPLEKIFQMTRYLPPFKETVKCILANSTT